MRTTLSVVLFWALLLAPNVHATPPLPNVPIKDPVAIVKLPEKLKARPGRLIVIQADTACKYVRWLCPHEDADLVPFPDGRSAIFSGQTPGTLYKVYAYTAAGDVPSPIAICEVTTEGPPKPPPPPPPPPAPPTPPAPDDVFFAPLKAGWDKEMLLARKDQLKYLLELFAEAAVEVTDSVRAPQATAKLYMQKLQADRTRLIGDNLNFLRAAATAIMDQHLPTDSGAALDGPARQKCSVIFARLSKCMEALQ